MAKGLFVTLEGSEGVGKSTQLRLLQSALASLGYDVLTTREPGGSPGAEDLRQLLLFGKNPLSLRAEILTHFAARADHLDQMIIPALDKGQIVICDRFTDSTMAYQGYGRAEGDPDVLDMISRLQSQLGRGPDMTFLLEVPRDIARLRLAARGAPVDRYEQSDEAFHARVSAGFREIARYNTGRIRRLNTDTQAEESLNSLIVKDILSHFARV
ncbi:dTMP kinase [Acetobacter orleanensis]|uniref:Thymidylate kinase n=1 Tax=Acetobacter orleanensis TaxID=104099 RepID=A0A4Y3TI77_9PROT|nr:dTMP kinase [Acetobacter orleanensis]KXV61995.1 thymidylate kinase [Acetobacter orleanensis]PCD80329.1 dTMP kinase [Acetobacter orleanensis]GAN68920.1 thymidylate(dTMP) kinase [Acetobacter orleanensis JCM 7639]GBR30729.1 thymidylate kinase [Acetobacter orleanensis NRIC 0473]GEB81672.1 thymidylate kinase [Acetobacter orleanensis]